jgi:hypothetical protein
MLTLLLWLSPIIVIAVIVWKFRRQAAEREAASNERLKAFLGETKAPSTADAAPNMRTSVDAKTTQQLATDVPSPSSAGFAVRERMLTPSQTLLYYLLKSGLPDHEVLTQVGIVSLIEVHADVSAFERETFQRRLAAAVADFVVCDKSFKAIAIVQCRARDGNAAEALAFARPCCESAGLRWVEIAPDALPKREAIRPLVLGS